MNKKISVGAAIALMVIASALTVSITMVVSMNKFNSQMFNINQKQAMYSKLSEIDAKVRENYIEPIDERKLNEDIAKGYINGIGDKYGMYVSAADYKKITEEYSGKQVGIGVEVVSNQEGNIYVYAVVPGAPAAASGIQKGDVIITVAGKSVKEIGYEGAIKLLKGDVDTKVSFVVQRGDKQLPFEITHVKYENVSVDSRKIGDKGYVRIKEFNDNTDEQFKSAVQALLDDGVTGLVFDVRNNPGGTLPSVAAILDYLLPSGNIVSSTDKNGVTKVLYTSDNKEIKLPMSVLMNGNTASAAELFSCALKDYNKASLIGTKTFGKGTMQQFFTLSDGSALDLSIARFNPPKSENFEGKGVLPDEEVQLNEEQQKNFYMLSDDADPQLQAALKALK